MMFNSHAKELANSMDLSQFDGIVCVSGDGVLVEVKKTDLKSNPKRTPLIMVRKITILLKPQLE
jgi:sphingosine kinase